MPSVHGEDAVIRILDKESISEQFHELRLDILGLPGARAAALPQIHRRALRDGAGDRADRHRGKTTTLYAALSEIKTIEDKIVTIEDPVEYQLRGITQIPINEKKGLTFARGLRSILRHDPDKIMVGEIRDNETAQIAINSALTGHLVFTTVHANNVVDVLGRFLNMGVEPYQFVSALNCVLAQRLVRNICLHCKRPAKVTREQLVESAMDPTLADSGVFFEGAGCIECGGTGFKGRTAICELLDLTDNIREIILARKPTSEVKKAAREEGMRSLRESAVERVLAGDHDAARDQQGDVRRMSPLPSFLDQSAAVGRRRDRLGSGDGRVARRGRAAAGSSARTAIERLPRGRGDAGAQRASTSTTRRAWSRRCVRRSTSSGRGQRRVALVIPDTAAKVSLLRFEKVPAAVGPRSADSLADAEGGAVQARRGGDLLGARRRRCRTAAASIWSRLARRDVIESYRGSAPTRARRRASSIWRR